MSTVPGLAVFLCFGARRNASTAPLEKVSGTGKGLRYSGTGKPGPHPSTLKPGGWQVSKFLFLGLSGSHDSWYYFNNNCCLLSSITIKGKL